MEFKKLLEYYRDRAGLNKTGLAERLSVTPSYVMEIESGRKPPPSIDRCRAIAKILSLSSSETQSLIDAAVEERLAPDELLWLTERDKKYAEAKKICTDEVLAALKDSTSFAALMTTYKSKAEIKAVLQVIIENIEDLPKDKRKEILKYCQ